MVKKNIFMNVLMLVKEIYGIEMKLKLYAMIIQL